MECECVYVDKLHCTLNGVCDYTSSCVLHRSCPWHPNPSPSLPSPPFRSFSISCSLSRSCSPISPSLTTVPHGQSCGHTTWLLAAQECSWQKQPEAHHVEKIQSAHSIHSTPHPATPHFLQLSKRSTGVFPSPVHLWREMAWFFSCLDMCMCVQGKGIFFFFFVFVSTMRGCCFNQVRFSLTPHLSLSLCLSFSFSLSASLRSAGRFSLSVWVALLMSCNIKLAVSESSQLSVGLVVLACRAAHLCLLDKTFPALPREHTLSPLLFFLLLSFTLFQSISINPFVCLSRSFLAQYVFLFYFSFFFFWVKPNLPAVLCTLFFLNLYTLLLFFCYPFSFPTPSLPRCPFLILYYFGTSLSALRLKPHCLFAGGVHLSSAPGWACRHYTTDWNLCLKVANVHWSIIL